LNGGGAALCNGELMVDMCAGLIVAARMVGSEF